MGWTAVTGAAALGGLPTGASAQDADRAYLELRRYLFPEEGKKKAFAAFLKDAAIPAANRLGVAPVGVFEAETEPEHLYVLLPHATIGSFAQLTEKLLADTAFRSQGAAVLDAPASDPAFTRVEISLFVAFRGMPRLETPASGPDRVFQLRIYESPSVKTGQKKIEMFDVKEIEIFRKTGLNPVFFGEALAGTKIPNLTYMLGFATAEAMEAAWDRFKVDPEWLELRAKPEYEDKKILSGITNVVLKPVDGSQI